MDKRLIAALALLLVAAPVAAAAHPWAKPGAWALYRVVVVLKSSQLQPLIGTSTVESIEVVKVTVVSVNSTGFVADVRVVSHKVLPSNISKNIPPAEVKEARIYVPFDKEPMARPFFYADPSKLPPNGTVSVAIEEAPLKAHYDTRTGWLLDAYAQYSKGGVNTTFAMTLLKDSFGCRPAASSGSAAPLWVLPAVAAGTAAAIVGAYLYLVRRRG